MSEHVFSEADLPINSDGRIYHLDLAPGEIASSLLIVGDPERVPLIANRHLKKIEVDRYHRGLRTITGYPGESDQRVTILTSGMGTPSLEIVLQEIVALHEVDFCTRKRKSDWPQIKIIRVGTSGGLQQSTELGTPIITTAAIGLDNTALFYDWSSGDDILTQLEKDICAHLALHQEKPSRFRGCIWPYVAKADSEMVAAMSLSARQMGVEVLTGITASSSGFFANQGRDITRVKPTIPEIDRILAAFSAGGSWGMVQNMEMETSFLLHFMGALGHKAGAICPAIANRSSNTFADTDLVTDRIHQATAIALEALVS